MAASNPTYTRPGVAIAIAAAFVCGLFSGAALYGGLAGLQTWQTLLAALIALGGGTLAYRGGMAKIAMDRELYDDKISREVMATMLRLSFAAQTFETELKKARAWADPGGNNPRELTRRDIRLNSPAEFNEAWAVLELLPTRAMYSLANIRHRLHRLEASAAAGAPDARLTTKDPEVVEFLRLVDKMMFLCRILMESLTTSDRVREALNDEAAD